MLWALSILLGAAPLQLAAAEPASLATQRASAIANLQAESPVRAPPALSEFRSLRDATGTLRSTIPTQQAVRLLTQTYAALGRGAEGAETLRSALETSGANTNEVASVELLEQIGGAYRGEGAYFDALLFIEEAVLVAKETEGPDEVARLLNEAGTILASVGEFDLAIDSFSEAITTLPAGRDAQVLSIRLNRARVQLEAGRVATLAEEVAALPTGSSSRSLTPELRLSMVKLLLDTAEEYPGERSSLMEVTEGLLRDLGKESLDPWQQGYVIGYRGRSAELLGDTESALALTRRALRLAQANGHLESLYLWEWQMGRLLAEQNPDQAAKGYEQSIATLASIRTQLTRGTFASFQQQVGPVYLEYADLILRQAQAATGANKQTLLNRARLVMERVKQAEIEEYFRSECAVEDVATSLDAVAADAAVIYPVILGDRTEVLVSIAGTLHQVTVPVPGKDINRVISEFRRSIEGFDYESDFYDDEDPHLYFGQRLYDWLVRPYLADLLKARVKTLVFVPGGALRTVPPAAFYSGSEYLIEQFSIAVTPGLRLTDPTPLARQELRVLRAGVTESVQGFPPLAAVNRELDQIGGFFSGTELKDSTFLLQDASREMALPQYNVVHLATHGHFDRQAERSFLLTFDDRLTLGQIEQSVGRRRYSDEPLELIVLSACQTALGDERAALGLAGIALKAGARSAVASLWYISDVATEKLITGFYEELKNPAISKAEALRQSQLVLIADPVFEHPNLWAPLMLIGNWL